MVPRNSEKQGCAGPRGISYFGKERYCTLHHLQVHLERCPKLSLSRECREPDVLRACVFCSCPVAYSCRIYRCPFEATWAGRRAMRLWV